MYSANHGTHLQSGGYDANQRPDSTYDLTLGLADMDPNPYAGRVPGPAGSPSVQRLQLYKPHTWLNSVSAFRRQSGNSLYRAGVLDELPFARRNRWLGGWQLNTITAIQTGVPLMITGANNFRATRPDNTGQSAHLDNRSAAEWFNTQVFYNPPIYEAGTTGRT